MLLLIVFLNTTIVSFGQTELPLTAVQEQYANNKEATFVHTDKEAYLAGEIVWYKIYLLNTIGYTTANYNTIVYIELVNDKGAAVLQSKVELKKGLGSGSLYLPVTINTGAYTLISYTSQMKNGDPKLFFRKRVVITNALSANGSVLAASNNNAIVNFFPEGGDLIEGLITKVGVQVLDPGATKGIQAIGYILENETDTVARFETAKFGLGQFTYTPHSGKRYTAVVTVGNKAPVKTGLPTQKLNGHTISVTDAGKDAYKIIVSAQRAAPQKMYLVAHSDQTNKMAVEFDMDADNSFAYNVDKSRLGTGIIYFTLFNQHWQPVSERLVFIPQELPVTGVKISTEKNIFAGRENAPIELEPLQASGNSGVINASLSVYATDTNGSSAGTIHDYLLLTRHLAGKIEAPEFYFTPEAQQGNYIDNLMLVNGWRRFNTATTTGKKPVALPEYNGHIITARITNTWTNKPEADAACFLTVPSVPFGLFNGTSDAAGMVRFNITRYYGPGDIFIKPFPTGNNADTYRIDIISPFADSTSKIFYQPGFYLNPADSVELLKRSIAMQAQNIYNQDKLNRFLIPSYKDTLPFYDKPEITYLLDNYKRFSTMEEVLREYVTPINVVVRDKKLKMTFYDEKNQTVYRYAALVLLDGVPLADYNSIFNYDPFKVKQLDVIPRRFVIGSAVYSGIASFQTYDSKFNGFELDPSAIPIDYEGLELKREFFSPEYATNKGDLRIPDYRTTLLWNPDIRFAGNKKQQISCFTSDYTGTYKIVLQGITEDGKPVYGESTFKVDK
ncbi:hypothetical protein NIASO_14665 [Niabella soli DSM 19437]|uniref:Macroglobulin domain-containing protein n=1 Tax=Niabella soli DSM 19437 TaxID=929713 RepID=W0F429_9BACT|nr:hypothetical protein NIASO_14665 [Niabella soli DSM 19437]